MNQISGDINKRVLAKCRKFTDQTTGEAKIEFQHGFFRFLLQK